MSEITITELEDKEVVYLFGVPQDAPESVRQWMYDEDGFKSYWKKNFENAQCLMAPAEVRGVEALEVDEDHITELMEDE